MENSLSVSVSVCVYMLLPPINLNNKNRHTHTRTEIIKQNEWNEKGEKVRKRKAVESNATIVNFIF